MSLLSALNLPSRLADRLPLNPKQRALALTAGGMVALLGGRKIIALGAFGKGLAELEGMWREKNDFDGPFDERWERAIAFYEETHVEPTNRKLHVVGIPMILGGAAGLLLFRPYRPLWAVAAGSFTLGWVLNLVGHAAYEKNAPAFADDPLSFLAGPVWDLKHGGKKRVITPAGDEFEVAFVPDLPDDISADMSVDEGIEEPTDVEAEVLPMPDINVPAGAQA